MLIRIWGNPLLQALQTDRYMHELALFWTKFWFESLSRDLNTFDFALQLRLVTWSCKASITFQRVLPVSESDPFPGRKIGKENRQNLVLVCPTGIKERRESINTVWYCKGTALFSFENTQTSFKPRDCTFGFRLRKYGKDQV